MNNQTQATGDPVTVAITIPGTGTAGGTQLKDLLAAGGIKIPWRGQSPSYLYIDAKIPGIAGTARSAFTVASPRQNIDGTFAAVAGTDHTSHGKFVAADTEWYCPANEADNLYLRSTTAGTVSALVTILYDKVD